MCQSISIFARFWLCLSTLQISAILCNFQPFPSIRTFRLSFSRDFTFSVLPSPQDQIISVIDWPIHEATPPIPDISAIFIRILLFSSAYCCLFLGVSSVNLPPEDNHFRPYRHTLHVSRVYPN